MLHFQPPHGRQHLLTNWLNRLHKLLRPFHRQMLLNILPPNSQEMNKRLSRRTGLMLHGSRTFDLPHSPGLRLVFLREMLSECGAEVDEVLAKGLVLVGGHGGREGEGAELGDGVGG